MKSSFLENVKGGGGLQSIPWPSSAFSEEERNHEHRLKLSSKRGKNLHYRKGALSEALGRASNHHGGRSWAGSLEKEFRPPKLNHDGPKKSPGKGISCTRKGQSHNQGKKKVQTKGCSSSHDFRRVGSTREQERSTLKSTHRYGIRGIRFGSEGKPQNASEEKKKGGSLM